MTNPNSSNKAPRKANPAMVRSIIVHSLNHAPAICPWRCAHSFWDVRYDADNKPCGKILRCRAAPNKASCKKCAFAEAPYMECECDDFKPNNVFNLGGRSKNTEHLGMLAYGHDPELLDRNLHNGDCPFCVNPTQRFTQ